MQYGEVLGQVYKRVPVHHHIAFLFEALLHFVSPSADSRGAVVSYWRKYVHEVLINRLGGLSLHRKSVIGLTDRPDMTLDVYRGRKTTNQQQQQKLYYRYHQKCGAFGPLLK